MSLPPLKIAKVSHMSSPKRKRVRFEVDTTPEIREKRNKKPRTIIQYMSRKVIRFDDGKCTVPVARKLYERAHQGSPEQMVKYKHHLTTCAICRLVCKECYTRAQAQQKYRKKPDDHQLAALALFCLAHGASLTPRELTL